MATVWRAWDPQLEREVAIKEPMVSPNLSESKSAELRELFVREGRAAGRLNHPGIVTIYAADVFDGRPAIVMELLRGHPLSTLIDRRTLPFEASISILDQLLDALSYAHTMGVVHRDVKPDNVFVTEDGRVKLTDFGVAHISRLDGAGDSIIAGSPGYMSPEQINAQPVDARSDVFSTGVIAYEMFTGHNPFGATDGLDSTTIMYNTAHGSALDLSAAPNFPRALAAVILRATAKESMARFGSAEEMRLALEQASVEPEQYSDASLASLVDDAGAPNMGVSFTDATIGMVRENVTKKGSLGWSAGVAAAAAVGVLFLMAMMSGSSGSMGILLIAGGAIGGVTWLMVKQSKSGAQALPEEALALGAGARGTPAATVQVRGATEDRSVTVALPFEIGRSTEVQLVLADEMASRRHARVEEAGDGLVFVSDLGSRNGTFVNGAPVQGTISVGSNDLVVIGGTELRITRGAPASDAYMGSV